MRDLGDERAVRVIAAAPTIAISSGGVSVALDGRERVRERGRMCARDPRRAC